MYGFKVFHISEMPLVIFFTFWDMINLQLVQFLLQTDRQIDTETDNTALYTIKKNW